MEQNLPEGVNNAVSGSGAKWLIHAQAVGILAVPAQRCSFVATVGLQPATWNLWFHRHDAHCIE